jgi:hypothetical protein
MDDKVSDLLRLPDELLLAILGSADVAEWKLARQTCKSVNKIASSLLFSRVYFELCGRGCESLYRIS